MKKIVILMLAVFCHVAINAQLTPKDPIGHIVPSSEPIFSYATDGTVVANSKFIEQMWQGGFSDITPYKLKYSETINGYKVNCFRYKGWDDEPGDYDVISINDSNGKEIFTLNNDDDSWCYWTYTEHAGGSIGINIQGFPFPSEYKSFYPITLGNGATALVFCGRVATSQMPYIPIVVLKNGKATLVFNGRYDISELSQDNGKLNMRIASNTPTSYDSQGVPIYDNVRTITISNGVLEIFGPNR